MEDNIKVSIICIVYNQEKFIEDALKGFLMQKVNFNYEILIHDDASTDNTANIIREYEKKYPSLIKAIYQKENQYSKGKLVSTNLFEIAKGKYLAFCEGDDYWVDENKLQKQVNFLEVNEEYIATFHNVKTVDENNNPLITCGLWPIYEKHIISNVNELKYSNNLCGQTASIVCRNFWKEWNNFQKEEFIKIKTTGDRKLSFYFTMISKVYFFEEIMACYRKTYNTDSWSSKNAHKNLYGFMAKSLSELKKFENFWGYNKFIGNYPELFCGAIGVFLKKPSIKNFQIIIETFLEAPNKIRFLEKIFLKILNKIFKKDKVIKEYWKII